MHKLFLILLFISSIVKFSLAGQINPSSGDVYARDWYEISFTTSSSVAETNFWDVGTITVTCDSGVYSGYTATIDGFMDGTTTMKFRPRFPYVGRYTYSLSQSKGTSVSESTTGTIRCLVDTPSVKGRIFVDDYRMYSENGAPFYWMSETWWGWLEDSKASLSDSKQWMDSCAAQGFTVIQTRLSDPGSQTRTINSEIGWAWDSGNSRYDLDEINYSFYDNMDTLMFYAEKVGLGLCIGLSFANNADPLGNYTTTQIERWVQYIDARYGSLAAISWAIFWEFDTGSGTQSDYNTVWQNVITNTNYSSPVGAHPGTNSAIPMSKDNFDIVLAQYINQTVQSNFDNALTYADSIGAGDGRTGGNVEHGYYCDSGDCASGGCKAQDEGTDDEEILDNMMAFLYGGFEIIGTGIRNLWSTSCGATWSSSYLGVDYRTKYTRYVQRFRAAEPKFRERDTATRGGGSNYFHAYKSGYMHSVYFIEDVTTNFDFSDMSDTDGGRWYNLSTGEVTTASISNSASESLNPPAANYLFIMCEALPTNQIIISNSN